MSLAIALAMSMTMIGRGLVRVEISLGIEVVVRNMNVWNCRLRVICGREIEEHVEHRFAQIEAPHILGDGGVHGIDIYIREMVFGDSRHGNGVESPVIARVWSVQLGE